MSPALQVSLALILCLPTFAILGALYCCYPRATRGAKRLAADLAVCALAVAASALAMRWGFLGATGIGGKLWKQVVATLLTYGAFLAVLGVAWALRGSVICRRSRTSAASS